MTDPPCDGRTDGRAIAYSALCIMLSRAKEAFRSQTLSHSLNWLAAQYVTVVSRLPSTGLSPSRLQQWSLWCIVGSRQSDVPRCCLVCIVHTTSCYLCVQITQHNTNDLEWPLWVWIWIIIANLLTDISAMECARLRAWCSRQIWLLKVDTEANEVMESGNEFHSAAKDFWNWFEAQRGILSLCLVVDPLTGLSHRTRSVVVRVVWASYLLKYWEHWHQKMSNIFKILFTIFTTK